MTFFLRLNDEADVAAKDVFIVVLSSEVGWVMEQEEYTVELRCEPWTVRHFVSSS